MSLHQNFKQGQRYNFTVCLEGPLHGRISTDWFIEWMEANTIFDAQKILIHNLSIPFKTVYKLLETNWITLGS
ncbi:hypothetical protein LSH36_548g00003 [Paralvinella palmiformis]|uniref:Uncharacterized protein n=1 Tax=Paralvinella palmiformis TaxID=53620 RepID=A0AAD9MXM7_9ANNE|nr:hypothetical protein LSH36_548g00003 [Paralvinella palmiformis]